MRARGKVLINVQRIVIARDARKIYHIGFCDRARWARPALAYFHVFEIERV
jgi:hypothetical protein